LSSAICASPRPNIRACTAQQRARLLPVPYFLVTFTVPEQLLEPICAVMQPWYGALLASLRQADVSAGPTAARAYGKAVAGESIDG
jgi:hypothetical protein